MSEHIAYQELVAAADGELSDVRAEAVRDHLAACWTCRSHMKEIEDTISRFVRAHREAVPIAPAEAPQAMLRARLAELATQPPPTWRERFGDFLLQGDRLAYLGASMAAVAALLFVVGVVIVSRQQYRLLPDPEATPGVALPVSEVQICQTNIAPHTIPAKAGRKVFDRYGIDRPKPGDYELDYLIPPSLGGADDERNYWPQPYSAGEWNSHAKDALEDRLHELVCSNKLSLAAAQHEIASNWVAAYKKYFRTSGPLNLHRAFAKDAPWQP